MIMKTSLALASMSALVLMACNPYRPGTMEPATPNGSVRTTGCIDIAIDLISDPQAAGFATELRMGNRCDSAVTVDLGQIRATIRHGNGQISEMRVYDPEYQLRPALLDARARGREVLEYQLVEPGVVPGPNAELCLDIAGVDRGEPSSLPVVACTPVASASTDATVEYPDRTALRLSRTAATARDLEDA